MDRQRWGSSGTRRMDLTYSQLAVSRVSRGRSAFLRGRENTGRSVVNVTRRRSCVRWYVPSASRYPAWLRDGSWTMTPSERSRRTRPSTMGLWSRLWQNSMPWVRGSMVPSWSSSPRTSSSLCSTEALKYSSGMCLSPYNPMRRSRGRRPMARIRLASAASCTSKPASSRCRRTWSRSPFVGSEKNEPSVFEPSASHAPRHHGSSGRSMWTPSTGFGRGMAQLAWPLLTVRPASSISRVVAICAS